MSRIIFSLLLLSLCAVPAAAHQMVLTCWQDGNDLVANVSFSDGSYARGAKITLFSDSGDALFTGETDDSGECRAPITEAMRALDGDIRIVANAGMGHRTERRLAAQALTSPSASVATAQEVESPAEDALVEIMRELLHQELAPIRRDLAALQHAGPGVTEIIGGIGYIVGIAGLASYIMRRRKGQD